jgi:hypothetical protein
MAAAITGLVNLVEKKELVLDFLQSIDFISGIKGQCDYYKEKSSGENCSLPLFFDLKIDFHEIANKSE